MTYNNCESGFNWDGMPTGTESELAGVPAYVFGNSKSAAVLFVSDIFGWTLNNARRLADHYTKESNATVYVPDWCVPVLTLPHYTNSGLATTWRSFIKTR